MVLVVYFSDSAAFSKANVPFKGRPQILCVTKDLQLYSYINIYCWYVPQARSSSLMQLSRVFHVLSTTTQRYKVNHMETTKGAIMKFLTSLLWLQVHNLHKINNMH